MSGNFLPPNPLAEWLGLSPGEIDGLRRSGILCAVPAGT